MPRASSHAPLLAADSRRSAPPTRTALRPPIATRPRRRVSAGAAEPRFPSLTQSPWAPELTKSPSLERPRRLGRSSSSPTQRVAGHPLGRGPSIRRAASQFKGWRPRRGLFTRRLRVGRAVPFVRSERLTLEEIAPGGQFTIARSARETIPLCHRGAGTALAATRDRCP